MRLRRSAGASEWNGGRGLLRVAVILMRLLPGLLCTLQGRAHRRTSLQRTIHSWLLAYGRRKLQADRLHA